jgi:hypothetical protein
MKVTLITDESTDESNLYLHPWMKVSSFLPKTSAPIRKVGEKTGVMAIIVFT